jgi:hypothetical protein
MIYLQGAIGYTIFVNKTTNKKIIIFSDMHDNLPPCPFVNEKISKWLNKRKKNCKILLEEVRRTDNMQLESLWAEAEHTNELKNLYLNNLNDIEPIDIRPELILFSWEIVDKINNNNITLKQYLKLIINFFKLKNDFLQDKIININNILKKHLDRIILKFNKYLSINENYLHKTISYIFNNNSEILEKFNIILNDCMEWYICLLIEKYKTKNIIIHAGLYHTIKINFFMKNVYNHFEKKKVGINNFNFDNREKYLCQLFDNNNLI